MKPEDIIEIEAPILNGAERLYMPQILTGMGVTLRHMFGKKSTIQYPEEKRILRTENYRGVHRLNRDQDGRVACVACFM